MSSYLLFICIIIIGELVFNLTWYKYLKRYFNFDESSEKVEASASPKSKSFLFLQLSVFKGVMERFVITIGLIMGFTPILIVFGTIKLGTRFKDNQDVKNDYFLIGNLSSIIISILYFYLYKKIKILLGMP